MIAVSRESLSALRDDRDTLDLDENTALRLRWEPDYMNPFDEYGEDAYGTVEWVRSHDDPRPEGFDGNAEKISTRDGTLWWQPSPQVKRTDEGFALHRAMVLAIIEDGMWSVGVELLHDTDTYGHPIVVDAAWLGGIEPCIGTRLYPQENDWHQEIIRDLVSMLEDVTLIDLAPVE